MTYVFLTTMDSKILPNECFPDTPAGIKRALDRCTDHNTYMGKAMVDAHWKLSKCDIRIINDITA
jgi:hypothetical protein